MHPLLIISFRETGAPSVSIQTKGNTKTCLSQDFKAVGENLMVLPFRLI
jgi:hypothetical protein